MSQATLKLKRGKLVEQLHHASLSLLCELRQASNAAFGSVGLTYGQALLLIFVEHGVSQPKDLAEALGVIPQALSALVSRLTDQGLLARDYNQVDGRRVEIRLTPLGIELCREVNEAWREHNPIDTKACSDDEIEMLITVSRNAERSRAL